MTFSLLISIITSHKSVNCRSVVIPMRNAQNATTLPVQEALSFIKHDSITDTCLLNDNTYLMGSFKKKFS